MCFLQYIDENIEKPLVFLGCLHSDCKKHYKTSAFCNILLIILKNRCFSLFFCTQIAKHITKPVLFAISCWKHWGTFGFPLVFCTQIAKNNTKPVFFAIFCRKWWKTCGFPLFICPQIAKSIEIICFFAFFPYGYLYGYPWRRPGRPRMGSVS